ncbi:hypothetical protein GOP47_0002719 [Adiantum capillus-veneris]|uniref:UBR-type domain-containing protein n=1 Tax=Adiantum capillus-veneris TaxID=13818 RepID=A0A9D4ZR70_ADICA|nr:hypothetical protein GOP47_0002719 [Adiantum capillus-veneris]
MGSNSAANGGAEAQEEGPITEDEEGVLTINEYVEGLEAQELEVDMILGGDDGKECTYPKGYLPRQAVFSCITCCPDGNAGVCTACSMNCHDGHEIIEIWTRRHFRCDCGNSKFGIGACKLFSSKDSVNEENVYNKNYKGLYCACNRPYPDPDAVEDMGEMLQCCICEDWFHEAHLGLASTEEVPRDEEGEPCFDEVICQVCAVSLDFLSHYRTLMVPLHNSTSPEVPAEFLPVSALDRRSNGIMEEGVEGASETNVAVPEPSRTAEKVALTEINTLQTHQSDTLKEETNTLQAQQSESLKQESMDRNLIHGGAICSNGTDKNKADCSNASQPCKILSGEASGSVQNGENGSLNHCAEQQNTISSIWTDKALFLIKNWRSQLCRCNACLERYAKKHVSFLMDADDTITKYEEVAKEKRKEKMDACSRQDLSFLNGMSHVGKIEFMHGLSEMTSELSAFFASRESGKAITSADIYEVFENLKKKKRARLE